VEGPFLSKRVTLFWLDTFHLIGRSSPAAKEPPRGALNALGRFSEEEEV